MTDDDYDLQREILEDRAERARHNRLMRLPVGHPDEPIDEDEE
jgi:hypothetical protein